MQYPHPPPATPGERKTENTGCFAYVRKIYESNKKLSDLSALDFKVCRYALSKGFSIDDIKEAIRQLSPNIESRKKGHTGDYIQRTVKNALSR